VSSEASIFEGNKWLNYGSPIFLNFSSISSKSAHDIRVANIENCSLNKMLNLARKITVRLSEL
jgi:hypothetical protein